MLTKHVTYNNSVSLQKLVITSRPCSSLVSHQKARSTQRVVARLSIPPLTALLALIPPYSQPDPSAALARFKVSDVHRDPFRCPT